MMLGSVKLIPDESVKVGSVLFMTPNDPEDKMRIFWVWIDQITPDLFDRYKDVYVNADSYNVIKQKIESWQDSIKRDE
jgi:hypothetical protein